MSEYSLKQMDGYKLEQSKLCGTRTVRWIYPNICLIASNNRGRVEYRLKTEPHEDIVIERTLSMLQFRSCMKALKGRVYAEHRRISEYGYPVKLTDWN